MRQGHGLQAAEPYRIRLVTASEKERRCKESLLSGQWPALVRQIVSRDGSHPNRAFLFARGTLDFRQVSQAKNYPFGSPLPMSV
jgi:hypothetical protein